MSIDDVMAAETATATSDDDSVKEARLPVGSIVDLRLGKLSFSRGSDGELSTVECLLSPKMCLPPPCNVFDCPEPGLPVAELGLDGSLGVEWPEPVPAELSRDAADSTLNLELSREAASTFGL